MSVATTSRQSVGPPVEPGRRALAEVRTALTMVAADPYARRLLAATTPLPSTPGPLADWLYLHWWCGPDRPTDSAPADRHTAAAGAARLEAARRTQTSSSPGWLVLAAAGELLVAAPLRTAPGEARGEAPGDRTRTTTDAVLSSSRPGLPPRPGDLVTLQSGSSGLDPTGAWWWAHSGRGEELLEDTLDRWYVHARDLDAATRLVPLLLALATEAGCRLSLKCSPDDSGYGRRDALVVYLPRRESSTAEAGLRKRAAMLADLVDPDVPPLTRLLLPGIAQAEDPGPGAPGHGRETALSYGQLRCSQVAAVAGWLIAELSLDPATIADPELAVGLARVGVDVAAPERLLR